MGHAFSLIDANCGSRLGDTSLPPMPPPCVLPSSHPAQCLPPAPLPQATNKKRRRKSGPHGASAQPRWPWGGCWGGRGTEMDITERA